MFTLKRNIFWEFIKIYSFVFPALVRSSDCMIAADEVFDNCFACNPDYFSELEASNFQSTFPSSMCFKKREEPTIYDIFVQEKPCKQSDACDGSVSHPFDSFIIALEYAHLNSKALINSSINIYLKGEEHYIYQHDLEKSSIKHFFRKIKASIKILPFSYFNSNFTKVNIIKRPTLVLKTNELKIFVSGSLKIYDVMIIGNDLALTANPEKKHECSSIQKICCNETSINFVYDEFVTADRVCGMREFQNYKPKDRISWGLFNIESFYEYLDERTAELTIENSQFLNLILHNHKDSGNLESALTLIAISSRNLWKINYSNISFDSCFLTSGLLTFQDFYAFFRFIKYPFNSYEERSEEIIINYTLFTKYNIYGIESLQPHDEGLLLLRGFEGRLILNETIFREYLGSFEYFKVFDLSSNKMQIIFNSIVVEYCDSHIFLVCEDCAFIQLTNISFFEINRTTCDIEYIKISSENIIVEQIYFLNIVSAYSNGGQYSLSMEGKKKAIKISNVIIEKVLEWNILFSNAVVFLENMIIIDSLFSKNIVLFLLTTLHADSLIIRDVTLIFNRAIEINSREKDRNSDFEFVFNISRLSVSNYFIGKSLYISSFILWSESGYRDKLYMNNTLFENASTTNSIDDHCFLSAQFIYKLEIYNTIVQNFEEGSPPNFCLFYNFYLMKFINLTYKKIYRNRYYVLTVEGRGNLSIYNLSLIDSSLHFDSFFIQVLFLKMENIIFTNLYSVTRNVWYILTLRNTREVLIRNFSFISSDFSIYDPSDYGSPFGTNVINFKTCGNIYFLNGRFKIAKSNTIMNQLFLFSSYRNIFFSIENLKVTNFNCLKGFSGDLIYENGIISFVSSYSYILGAALSSTVIINDISIEDSFYCKNGLIGLLNIDRVAIRNLTTNNTKASSGGVLSLLFCVDVFIQGVYAANSEAIDRGGFIFSRGSYLIIIRSSFISGAVSLIGGAFCIRDTKILIHVEGVHVRQAFSRKAGAGLYLLATDCLIIGSSIHNAQSYEEGGGIYIKGKSLTILNDFICYACFASLGGFLFAEAASTLKIDQLNVIKSGAVEKGACILMFDVLQTEFLNILLYDINIYQGIGVIYVENQLANLYKFENITLSKIVAFECSFLSFSSFGSVIMKNILLSSFQGSVLHLFSQSFDKNQSFFIEKLIALGVVQINSNNLQGNVFSFQGLEKILLREILLMNILFKEHAFVIVSSSLELDEIWFQKESSFDSLYSSTFFFVKDSDFTLNSLFFDGQLNENLALMTATHSNITISITNIIKCQTPADSCLMLDNSKIYVENSYFSYCIANFVGVFSVKRGSFIIKNSLFKSNSFTNKLSPELHSEEIAANIHLFDCSKAVIILSSFIDTHYGVQIFTSFVDIICVWAQFSAFENSYNVKALWVINSNINISFCQFSGFVSEKGGALRLESTATLALNIFIFQSSFQFCVSDRGGVFLMKGYYEISIIGSFFGYNKALKLFRKSVGIAGVGYIDNPSNLPMIKLIINNSTFKGNRADSFFPTIFSNTLINTLMNEPASNEFSDNIDTFNFTDKFSCFPIIFIFYLENRVVNISEQFEILSGTPFNIKIEMLDHFKQRLAVDNVSKAYMQASKTSNFSYTYKGFQGSAKAKMGIFTFESTILNADPGSVFELNITFYISREISGLDNTLAVSNSLKFYSRPCIKGEVYYSDSKICLKCPPGQYSFEDPRILGLEDITCRLCPKNALCPGGDVLLPEPGYWRFSNTSTDIKHCLAEKACLGASTYNFSNKDPNFNLSNFAQGTCLKNNYGPFCFLCERNSARFHETDVCVDCEKNVLSYFKLAVALVFFSIYILFQVTLTMRSSKRGSYASPLLRQLINHFQLLGMISLLEIDFAPGIQRLLTAQEWFLIMNQYDFPVECFVSDIKYNLFSLKVVISTVSPLIFFLAILLIWVILHLAKRITSKEKFLDQMELTLLLTISLLFPQIIRACSSLLSCVSLDESVTKTVLLYSPDVNCWEKEHIYFILAATPGFICWGVLFPLYLSILLYKKRVWIKKIIKKTRPKDLIDDESTKVWDYLNYWRGCFTRFDNLIVGGRLEFRRDNICLASPEPETGAFANIIALVRHEEKKVIEKEGLIPEKLSNINFELSRSKREFNLDPALNLRKRILFDIESIYTTHKSGGTDIDLRKGILLKYVYLGYSSKFFYWEMVIYLKKFLLILVGNLKSVLPLGLLKLVLILLLGSFMIFQIRKQPFITDYLNNVQLYSALTIFLTVFFGIHGSNVFLEYFKTLFSVLVIMINIIFLFYWARIYWIHSSKNFTFIKKCFYKIYRIIKPTKKTNSLIVISSPYTYPGKLLTEHKEETVIFNK